MYPILRRETEFRMTFWTLFNMGIYIFYVFLSTTQDLSTVVLSFGLAEGKEFISLCKKRCSFFQQAANKFDEEKLNIHSENK